METSGSGGRLWVPGPNAALCRGSAPDPRPPRSDRSEVVRLGRPAGEDSTDPGDLTRIGPRLGGGRGGDPPCTLRIVGRVGLYRDSHDYGSGVGRTRSEQAESCRSGADGHSDIAGQNRALTPPYSTGKEVSACTAAVNSDTDHAAPEGFVSYSQIKVAIH